MQNFESTSTLFHSCYIPCLSFRFNNSDYIWLTAQNMKFPLLSFSFCYQIWWYFNHLYCILFVYYWFYVLFILFKEDYIPLLSRKNKVPPILIIIIIRNNKTLIKNNHNSKSKYCIGKIPIQHRMKDMFYRPIVSLLIKVTCGQQEKLFFFV